MKGRIAGHDDDFIPAAKLFDKLDAVHAGHIDVADDQIEALVKFAQGVFGTFEGDNLKLFIIAHGDLKGFSHIDIVFDNRYLQ